MHLLVAFQYFLQIKHLCPPFQVALVPISLYNDNFLIKLFIHLLNVDSDALKNIQCFPHTYCSTYKYSIEQIDCICFS